MLLAVNAYSVHYGQTARGYAFMLALLLAQISLVEHARSRGLSRRTNLALIAIGVALFLNTASLAFAWLAPLYLVLLWRAQSERGCVEDQPQPPEPDPFSRFTRLWKDKELRNWFWQAAIIGGFIAVFALFHLSEFRHARSRYGTPFDSLPAMIDVLWHAAWVVFPGWWMGVAVIGLVCAAAMTNRRLDHDWIALTLMISLTAILGYTLLSGAAPYGRTLGFLLPPALLAIAATWKTFDRSTQRGVSVALGLAVIAGTAQAAVHWKDDREGYNVIAREIAQRVNAAESPDDSFFSPLPEVYGDDMKMYLPENPQSIQFDPGAERITLLLAAETYGTDGQFRFPCRSLGVDGPSQETWEIPNSMKRWLAIHPPGDAWRVGLLEIPAFVKRHPADADPESDWLAVAVLVDSSETLNKLLETLAPNAAVPADLPLIPIRSRNARPGILIPRTEDSDALDIPGLLKGAVETAPGPAAVFRIVPEAQQG